MGIGPTKHRAADCPRRVPPEFRKDATHDDAKSVMLDTWISPTAAPPRGLTSDRSHGRTIADASDDAADAGGGDEHWRPPSGPEVTCQECFELLDEYVDLELAGQDADRRLPGMREHLEGWRACYEDRDSLRELVRLEGHAA
jgi:hypothetical protein